MTVDIATTFLRLSCLECAALYEVAQLDAVRLMMAAYEKLTNRPLPEEADNIDYLMMNDERALVVRPNESVTAFILQVGENICLMFGHDMVDNHMAICLFAEGNVFHEKYDFAREIAQKAAEAIGREVIFRIAL